MEQQLQQLMAAELQRLTAANSGASTNQRSDNRFSLGEQKSDINALFPTVLHKLLSDMEAVGNTAIVHWSLDGTSFQMQDERVFAALLPSLFPDLGNSFEDFRSELEAWGFENSGNVFLHPCFQRGNSSNCRFMRRQSRPQPGPVTTVNLLEQLLQGAVAAPPAHNQPSDTIATLLLAQMLQQQQQQQQPNSPTITPSAQQSAVVSTKQQPTPAQTPVTSLSTIPSPVTDDKKTKAASGKVFATAKRQAFLKKRSRTSSSTFRSSAKKAKAGSDACNKSSKERQNATVPRDKHSFVLNEQFRKGNDVPDLLFPWKLHDLLDDSERDVDIKTIVSWSDSASFAIHNEARFSREIMPKYFETKDWECFAAALASWGFVRFTSGAQEGSFIHRLFVKGRRSICKQMRIQGKAASELIKSHGQFLGRLHALLCYAKKSGQTSIVSWTKDGKKFTVHDPNAFIGDLYSLFFDSTTYGSFEQKLKRWGFSRNPAKMPKIGKETKLTEVSYWHPSFQRAKVPSVAWVMSPTKTPSTIRPEHNFLVRLRIMLNDAPREGNQLSVSWLPHGKAFMIRDRTHFSDSILPGYFKTKFTSFRQALRNHGFAQMGGNNWDEGAYYHKLFLRGEPLLCQGLTQDQMKNAMPDYVPSADEPNFYPDEDDRDSSLVDAANSIVSLKDIQATK